MTRRTFPTIEELLCARPRNPNILEKYRLTWNAAARVFEIPEGACPHPISGDGSAEQCIANGDCGCDEREKRNGATPCHP